MIVFNNQRTEHFSVFISHCYSVLNLPFVSKFVLKESSSQFQSCFVKISLTNYLNASFQNNLSGRSSRSQMFLKIGILENFARLTRKHQCRSLFLIHIQAQACNFIKNRLGHRHFLVYFTIAIVQTIFGILHLNKYTLIFRNVHRNYHQFSPNLSTIYNQYITVVYRKHQMVRPIA